MKQELFDRNIHITNVCPGPVVTNIVENAAQKDFDQVREFIHLFVFLWVWVGNTNYGWRWG